MLRRRRPAGWLLAAVGVVGASLVIAADAGAQSDEGAGGSADELVVAALEVEPFVVREGDVPGGFMFEVWDQIADELGVTYEVRWIESLDELRAEVQSGSVDLAVAPLSPSDTRERRVDFTSPVVTSGPVLAVHERTVDSTSLTQAVFSLAVLQLLLWGVLGLLVLGHFEWWFERRNSDGDFDPGYLRGVWDGVWWAMVTVTTVGYGDSTPRTARGRIVAMVAMVGSLFLAGAFVAQVTTQLQSERVSVEVSSLSDVDDRPVGVVDGAVYQRLLDEQGIETVAYRTQRQAFEGAEAGDVDLVVADLYTVRAIGDEFGLRSSEDVLYDDPIAYIVPQGSELREDVNAVLAGLHQRGVVREIVDRWVG